MKFSSPPFWERFNLEHDKVERTVDDRPGSYSGIWPEALYTSFEDLTTIFSHPLISGTLVDLGCGMGQSCLVYSYLHPSRRAIGVEFQKARLEVGEKIKEEEGLDEVTFINADLLESSIPEGDIYFLYFPTGPVLDRILFELHSSQKKFQLVAIESHGDLFPRLQKENWLKMLTEIPLYSKRHNSFARLYERTTELRDPGLLPHDLSFKEKFLLLGKGEEWIAETQGLQWSQNDSYDLLIPPRTIEWKEVRGVLSFDDFQDKIQLVLKLRRLGELEFATTERHLSGFIRKIYVKPTFGIEISSGERVEWSEIKSITQGSHLCYES